MPKNGDANDNILSSSSDQKTTDEITSIDQIVNRGSGLFLSGINGVRGAAIEAISRIYWDFPEYHQNIESFLEGRIIEEQLTSVRCVLVKILLPFYNHDREKCANLLEELVYHNPQKETALAPLITRDGIMLLQYILGGVPESGMKLVNCLINTERKKENITGALLIFVENYQSEEYQELYEQLICRGIEYKRIASQVAAECISVAEYRNKAIRRVQEFFNDDDEYVRKNAAQVFREFKPDEIEQYDGLIDSYLCSKVFMEGTFNFLWLLNKTVSDVHQYVIKFCERIFSDIKISRDNQKHDFRNYHYLEELLEKGYSSTENNSDYRKRYLDIIDTMSSPPCISNSNIVSIISK